MRRIHPTSFVIFVCFVVKIVSERGYGGGMLFVPFCGKMPS